MIQQWLNWRTSLAFIAICIVSGTIFYSQYLAKKIAKEERQNVEAWVEAQKTILHASDSSNLNLAVKISSDNNSIPIIETNEKDSITGNYVNLDSNKVKNDKTYLSDKLKEFKQRRAPIILILKQSPYTANKYYYGESVLLKEVEYYPIVQLFIVALFIVVVIIAQRINYQSTQNQVWAGMAKETAHQLGTPVTSLQGWIEMLKEINGNEKITPEIEKDVNRLLLISDRFGKIGSTPHLEEKNIVVQVQYMIDYIKRRAGQHVEFVLHNNSENIMAKISPPLFDWVIENLLKNALDAMEGKGNIIINIEKNKSQIFIDVIDNGKGISKKNVSKVFKPGFTTKKRGWGLGLTLTKRIIEQYHKGKIFVKQSEQGKGTTFRIMLNT
ncbi:sporulation kinase E [mine drainage metagenome]|uniref:Sporulation kinase E n=1 Tax=mine drainage metagenome TaxID=410659 RepID=A0A1J5SVM6_9ZZZZ